MSDKNGINQGGDEGIQANNAHPGKIGPSFVGGFIPIGNAGMAALKVLKSPGPVKSLQSIPQVDGSLLKLQDSNLEYISEYHDEFLSVSGMRYMDIETGKICYMSSNFKIDHVNGLVNGHMYPKCLNGESIVSIPNLENIPISKFKERFKLNKRFEEILNNIVGSIGVDSSKIDINKNIITISSYVSVDELFPHELYFDVGTDNYSVVYHEFFNFTDLKVGKIAVALDGYEKFIIESVDGDIVVLKSTDGAQITVYKNDFKLQYLMNDADIAEADKKIKLVLDLSEIDKENAKNNFLIYFARKFNSRIKRLKTSGLVDVDGGEWDIPSNSLGSYGISTLLDIGSDDIKIENITQYKLDGESFPFHIIEFELKGKKMVAMQIHKKIFSMKLSETLLGQKILGYFSANTDLNLLLPNIDFESTINMDWLVLGKDLEKDDKGNYKVGGTPNDYLKESLGFGWGPMGIVDNIVLEEILHNMVGSQEYFKIIKGMLSSDVIDSVVSDEISSCLKINLNTSIPSAGVYIGKHGIRRSFIVNTDISNFASGVFSLEFKKFVDVNYESGYRI